MVCNFKSEYSKVLSLLDVVTLAFFLRPGGVVHIPFGDMLFDYGRICVLVITIVRYFLCGKTSLFMVTMCCHYFFLFLATLVNDGSVFSFLRSFGAALGVVMLIEIVVSHKALTSLDYFSKYLTIVIILNVLSVIIYPDGIGNNFAGTPEYFLGIDNRFLYFYLPAVGLMGVDSFVKIGRLSKSFWIANMIAYLTLLYFWSVGAIISYTVFIVCYVLSKKEYFTLVFNIKYYFIFIIGMLVMLLSKAYLLFSDFIINVLKKDPTLSDRIFLWEKAIEVFLEYPLIGYGFHSDNCLINIFGHVTHPHNHFLYILYLSGIVGILFFILLNYIGCRNLHRYKKQPIVILISSILFSMYIALLADSFDYDPGLFLMLSIGANVNSILSLLHIRFEL